MSDTHTVEMTNGADTIYAPAEQEAYFKARGYSAAPAKTEAPADAKTEAPADAKTKAPADTKTKEATR